MLGYTLRQFRTYVQLCQRREVKRLRDMVWASSWGQADGKKVQEVLRKLDAAA